jgi:outer membrane biosynthesis protein TonB
MAAQSQQAKVLRIGIIQDGKIVQERLIKQGESVMVGESPKNTFVFPKTHLPKNEFPLFVHKGGAYHLHFTDAMKGKVSSNGSVVAIERLRTDPSVNQASGVWRLPLTENDRGKVGIDDVTVLFQFVPPPPVQAAAPLERMDFRPVWFEDDDPAYFAFLGLFAALAAVFAVGIYLAPEPPPQNFDQYKDRFAKVQEFVSKDLEREEPEKEEPKPEDLSPDREDATAKAKAEDKEEPKQAKVQEPPRNKVEAAKQREDQLQAMRERRRTLMIGTRGDSRGGTVDSAFDGGTLENLAKVSGGSLTLDGESGGTRGGKYETGDMQVDGNLDVGGPQSSKATAAPTFKVQVEAGKGDTFELEGSGDEVEKVIRRQGGALQACYETELRADPNLEGRIEVRFNISKGRVTSAEVVGNTSGNKALGDCVAARVKRWRFGDDVNGPVTWSWMFRKRG